MPDDYSVFVATKLVTHEWKPDAGSCGVWVKYGSGISSSIHTVGGLLSFWCNQPYQLALRTSVHPFPGTMATRTARIVCCTLQLGLVMHARGREEDVKESHSTCITDISRQHHLHSSGMSYAPPAPDFCDSETCDCETCDCL